MTSRAAIYRRRRLAVLAAALALVGLTAALISAVRSGDPPGAPPGDTSRGPTTSTTAPIDTSVLSDPARVGMP